MLTCEDVVDAHFCIADFFAGAESGEGMGGVDPKDLGNIISTIERQWTGCQGVTVFEMEYERVASLVYGIIKNHPFYDANKWTAFLCALLMIHRMGRLITVAQVEFENLMVAISDNEILKRAALKELIKKNVSHPEIRFLRRYLEKNSRKNASLRKTVKFRDLRRIIKRFGFDFENPLKETIDLVKLEE